MTQFPHVAYQLHYRFRLSTSLIKKDTLISNSKDGLGFESYRQTNKGVKPTLYNRKHDIIVRTKVIIIFE